MKLLDYMKERGLNDAEMALAIGDCSSRQVSKWKYGERTPRLPEILRIEKATKGAVRPCDFLPAPRVKSRPTAPLSASA